MIYPLWSGYVMIGLGLLFVIPPTIICLIQCYRLVDPPERRILRVIAWPLAAAAFMSVSMFWETVSRRMDAARLLPVLVLWIPLLLSLGLNKALLGQKVLKAGEPAPRHPMPETIPPRDSPSVVGMLSKPVTPVSDSAE